MKKHDGNGFTLAELLVVLVLVAILVSIALPASVGGGIKGSETKALTNAKQIGLAMMLYAGDHDGKYPDQQLTNGKANGKMVANSNQAFAQLIPTYFQTEAPFFIAKSKWSPIMPDNKIDEAVLDVRINTLRKRENAWAVMTGTNQGSNPRWPLIANGTNGTDTAYSADEAAYGGVFKGEIAVVVFNDQSANRVRLDPKDYKAKIRSSGADMLVYSAADDWLTATSVLVNPAK